MLNKIHTQRKRLRIQLINFLYSNYIKFSVILILSSESFSPLW